MSVPPPPPPPGKLRAQEEPTPTTTNGAPKAGVEIDWDDEDEATTVFDRTQEDSAQSLLRSAPPPPPPAFSVPPPPTRPPTPLPAAGRAPGMTLRPLSAPPPSLPRPVPPPARTTSSLPAPAVPAMSTATLSSETSPFGRSGGKRTWIYAAVGGVAVAAVLAIVAFLPGHGSLVVTAAGPGNKPVADLEIFVDGEKRCDKSPCQVKELPAGTHLVRISAPGYEQTADQAIKISSGDEAVHNVVLTRGGGTGLSVKAEGRGLKLWVDGKEIGPLPQELPDLEPGTHTVRVDGGDRYEPFEQSVTVEAGKMLSLEPKLPVKKGLATIKPGMNAEDARVVLVSGSERRPVPQLPLAVDIPVDKGYSIVATKRGFQDFEQKLVFEDGQAERTFVIDLSATAVATSEPSEPSRTPSAPPVAVATPRPPATPPAQKAPSGGGTLNLNSIPVSNVILDGKPLGPTPKLGVSVTPGTHTVIFVHAEHGRKAKSVNVGPGKTVPVVVKFE